MAGAAHQEDPVQAAKARVGTALNAKWSLDGLLGVGGMGAVFAARHRNGTRAAVKLLHAEFARESEIRERFLREGKIANSVDHPARVPVTDDDVSDRGEPFLVMDLLEGGTLNELRHKTGGKVPLEETLRIFETVLDLLAKCHEVGIVHRDIKPGNIFITNDGEVKVLDFGVARMREVGSGIEATRMGTAIGTPSYIAPEQALGLVSQVDGRSDIFSVGACMYVALTGKRLNHARTEAESFVMAATQAAPSIANLASDLPVEIVACVDRALAFEREKRFQDAASMRSEVLGLLAALRAGQLVRTAPKKEGGLKTRGNEALESLEELSPEEQKDVQVRLAAVWKQIGTCLADVRQYGWSHPHALRALDAGLQQVSDALATHPGSVRWDVGPGAFLFQGVPVWAPDRIPFDRIPYQLFADGVRHIQIKEGFTKDEFRDLVAIFLRDVLGGAGKEDDAVTAFWDRRFEHVAYVAIEAFAEGDGGGDADPLMKGSADLARELAQTAQLDRDWHDASLEGRAMRLNLSNQLRESGEAAAALALDPLQRATMGAQLNLTEERWLERFVDAFADGYVEARLNRDNAILEDALREWTADELSLHDHREVFEVFHALCAALALRVPNEARKAEVALARVMLPGPTLSLILQAVDKEGRDPQLAKELDSNIVTGIEKALHALADASMLELASGCWGSSRSEPLRRVLLAYMTQWSRGNEVRLGAVLESAPAELGVALVDLLAGLGTAEGVAALESARKNPHLAVRIEALTKVSSDREDEVRNEVRKMLDDPSAEARQAALALVAERGVIAAGPAIVLKIQAPDFHALEVDERRLWLGCLLALSPRRAMSVCVEILKEHQIIPTEAVETTRVLAAEILSNMASKEALEAAMEASKKRWWNTTPVREAAERAVEQIQQRIKAGVGEPTTTAKRKKVELP
ncbi:MAG: eukaryotic-like serine/threonine-protein kinase [Myxococcales bacterium]|nr:eukaryotic-like serine/threonine-protein kinase [Myxococcales bacterium]